MISGEIHVFLEPFVNMDLVKKFGEEGIEVHPGHSLYDWLVHKTHVNTKRKSLERISKKYIPMDIGGEAIWVMGEYIECQRDGFDGFVHVYPFTCMPEVTCRGIIEGQTPDPFYLPIQFYSFDENTGFEGMRTRIEAFIDLMKSNRENNPRFQNTYVEPRELAEIYDQPLKKPTFFDRIIDLVKPSFDFIKVLLSEKKKSSNKIKDQQVEQNPNILAGKNITTNVSSNIGTNKGTKEEIVNGK
jgi:predicted nucleotide-binding protein (sugar kinase/HSP70/actin superfamily)